MFDTFNLQEFEAARAILISTPPEPLFMVSSTHPLQSMIDRGQIPAGVDLQVGQVYGKPIAFLTAELLLFDVAQSVTGDQPWMVSFCPICNAGAIFNPVVDNVRHTFAVGGIYNAMSILRDIETGSYWNHIHGVCVHGERRGVMMERLGVLHHMRPTDALAAYPNLELASAPLNEVLRSYQADEDEFRRAAQPEWSSRLMDTWVQRDERLPRYNMGLGIWTNTSARYYPILEINSQNNAVLDEIDSRKILVYINPATDLPDAIYTDASSFRWEKDTIKLDTGQIIENGLVQKDGQTIPVERPMHLFIRWYAFAVLFRNCQIYRS